MQAEASASHSDVMGPANWVGQAAEHLTFSPTHHSLGLTVFRTPGQKGEQLVRIVGACGPWPLCSPYLLPRLLACRRTYVQPT